MPYLWKNETMGRKTDPWTNGQQDPRFRLFRRMVRFVLVILKVFGFQIDVEAGPNAKSTSCFTVAFWTYRMVIVALIALTLLCSISVTYGFIYKFDFRKNILDLIVLTMMICGLNLALFLQIRRKSIGYLLSRLLASLQLLADRNLTQESDRFHRELKMVKFYMIGLLVICIVPILFIINFSALQFVRMIKDFNGDFCNKPFASGMFGCSLSSVLSFVYITFTFNYYLPLIISSSALLLMVVLMLNVHFSVLANPQAVDTRSSWHLASRVQKFLTAHLETCSLVNEADRTLSFLIFLLLSCEIINVTCLFRAIIMTGPPGSTRNSTRLDILPCFLLLVLLCPFLLKTLSISAVNSKVLGSLDCHLFEELFTRFSNRHDSTMKV